METISASASLDVGSAQVLIAGRVVDDLGAPIEGARVSLVPRGIAFESAPLMAAVSLADGSFEFGMPSGDSACDPTHRGFEVRARAPGYVPAARRFGGTDGEEIVLELRRSYRLQGFVRMEDTALPAARATIDLLWLLAPPNVLASTGSADDGSFEFDEVPAGIPIALDVSLPARFPFRAVIGVPTISAPSEIVSVDVRLPGGITVTVRTVDGQTGAPMSGSRISIAEKLIGTTGPDGLLEIDDLTAGGSVLTVKQSGYCAVNVPLRKSDLSPDKPFEIPLLRSATIAGFVTDASGQPIPDAWVYGGRGGGATAESVADDWLTAAAPEGWSVAEPAGVRSDGRGSYELSGLVAGPTPFLLCVRRDAAAEDTGALVAEIVLGTPGMRVTEDVVIRATGTIVGTVLLDQAPCPFATITAIGEEGTHTVNSGGDGSFHVGGLLPGTWLLEVVAAGVRHEEEIPVLAEAVVQRHVSLFSRDPSVTTGALMDVVGEPVSAALVTVQTPAGPDAVRTAEDGTFRHEWFGEPGASMRFIYQDALQRVESDPVPAGASGVVVRVRRGCLVTIVVKTPSTEPPVQQVRIEWRDAGVRSEWRLLQRTFQCSDSGEIGLSLPAGAIDVRVREHGNAGRTGEISGLRVSPEGTSAACWLIAD